MHYLGRRPTPDLYYEDMIMAAVYFGVKVLCENQKPGLLNHFNRRGYKNYIDKTQVSDYTMGNNKKYMEGISMSGNLVRQQAIDNLVSYIYKYVGKITYEVQKEEFGWKDEDLRDDLYGSCPFTDMIDDWLKFDANKWTIYDSTVASMITLLAVTPVKNKKNPNEELKAKISLGALFKKHNL